MLHRLLLFHGRKQYISVSNFILYFFYKNAVLTMPQFFFAYFSGYSAITIFDDFYIQLYNTVYTGVPVVVLGLVYWDL